MANKRYDQFTSTAPTTSRILLTADPATGTLGKCTTQAILTLQPTVNQPITAMQNMGSPILGTVMGINPLTIVTDYVPPTNQSYYWMVPLPSCTVTGAWFLLYQAGVFTATNFNGFALYSIAGNVLTQIAITANSPASFKSPNLLFTQIAFTAPVTVTAGSYFLAMLISGTSFTTVIRFAQNSNIGLAGMSRFNMSGFLQAMFILNPATTLPGSITLSAYGTSGGTIPVAGVY